MVGGFEQICYPIMTRMMIMAVIELVGVVVTTP
jgi:hypothetical protein